MCNVITKIKYIMYNFKDNSFIHNNTVCVAICARVDILLTCGKHLHDRIVSLRGEVWAHKVA